MNNHEILKLLDKSYVAVATDKNGLRKAFTASPVKSEELCSWNVTDKSGKIFPYGSTFPYINKMIEGCDTEPCEGWRDTLAVRPLTFADLRVGDLFESDAGKFIKVSLRNAIESGIKISTSSFTHPHVEVKLLKRWVEEPE